MYGIVASHLLRVDTRIAARLGATLVPSFYGVLN